MKKGPSWKVVIYREWTDNGPGMDRGWINKSVKSVKSAMQIFKSAKSAESAKQILNNIAQCLRA